MLKCDEKSVDIASEEFYQELARRNYELDVLQTQVREISKAVSACAVKKILESENSPLKG